MRIEGQQDLSARTEEFDSFWEGPEDVEKGYSTFGKFYRANYQRYLPGNRDARTLVLSCGPGYFVNLLVELGYSRVLGIDSRADKIEHYYKHAGDLGYSQALYHFNKLSDLLSAAYRSKNCKDDVPIIQLILETVDEQMEEMKKREEGCDQSNT